MTNQLIIDEETLPKCKIEKKMFEWGEPYDFCTPIFDTNLPKETNPLESSIDFFGKNNFKNQLLLLHNAITNFEESYRIENFNKEILDREFLINKIHNYLENNKNKNTPWDKYSLPIDEIDYIKLLYDNLNFKLNFIKTNK
jgi:hypothetical protein